MKITFDEVDEYHPRELTIRFDTLVEQSLFLSMVANAKTSGLVSHENLAAQIENKIAGFPFK